MSARKLPEVMWAIVQHSGVLTGHTEFSEAVEHVGITTEAQKNKVEKAGGLVFADWSEADRFCEDANYPPEVTGILPRVKGSFSTQTIDGSAIYVPVREVVG